MRVLLTGAFGNVGLSVLKELIDNNHNIRILEIKNRKNLKISQKIPKHIEILWGDITNKFDVERAVKNRDIIIHLAAIIPPLADKLPDLAEQVNVYGTKNILDAMKKQSKKIHLIFSSSIAVYGDRRKQPLINPTDQLNPSKGDFYALTKISAENMIKFSGFDYTIFRLTYITSINKLDMDPLMFHMPLDTSIEICDTRDVGLAIINAIDNKAVLRKTFNIAGGKNCRTTYRKYLNEMMELFGLGKRFLPDEAFSDSNFHCGFMDTSESQKLLQYQNYSLKDYYKDVKKKIGIKKYFIRFVKSSVRSNLLRKSEPYIRFRFFKRKMGSFTVTENKLIRRLLSNNFKKIKSLEKKVSELEETINIFWSKNDDIEYIPKT